MALRTSRLAIKQREPAGLRRGERRLIASEISVKRAVMVLPFAIYKRANRVGDMHDGELSGAVDIVKRGDKHLAIPWDSPHPFGEDRPDVINSVV